MTDPSSPAGSPAGRPPRIERVVLIGFMASGKTTVARRLAAELDWGHFDVDDLVEQEEGRSISEIFAESGEEVFRAIEARLADQALRTREAVISVGGGWAAQKGRVAELPPETVSVWLEVSPEEAVRRANAEGPTRPLLDAPDPVSAARELLTSRSDAYASARWAVDTEGRTVEDVSARILELLRSEDPEVGVDHGTE